MNERQDSSLTLLDSDESFSLAVVTNGNRIVLGNKTRGFGTGMLVLPGGKNRYCVDANGLGLIPGPIDASREVREETGLDIDPNSFVHMARLNIDTEDDFRAVSVYQARSGDYPLVSTGELEDLAWHDVRTLPYDKMPRDYEFWLPHVLAGYAVTAFFTTNYSDLVGAKIFRQPLEPIGRLEELPAEEFTINT
jgi:8-oxo-dGTP diphosphatase